MRINLNRKVRVVFTRHGKETAVKTRCSMRQLETGEFHLWELMSLFGAYTYMGMPQPLFENNYIEILEEE